MNTQLYKTGEERSNAVANNSRQNKGNAASESTIQRKLQEIANNSRQVSQLRAYQAMANNYASQTLQKKAGLEEEALQGKFEPVQKKGGPEEELLQGKFNIIQKKGPEEEMLQGKFEPVQRKGNPEEESLQGKFKPVQKKANNTGLPDQLKSGVENLSGHSMDDVKVHYNSDKPSQVQAHAYAQGTDIHVAPGQEKHLPHEAWHVVQQKQGRVQPTMQMKEGVPVNDSPVLETEADVMGAKALSS